MVKGSMARQRGTPRGTVLLCPAITRAPSTVSCLRCLPAHRRYRHARHNLSLQPFQGYQPAIRRPVLAAVPPLLFVAAAAGVPARPATAPLPSHHRWSARRRLSCSSSCRRTRRLSRGHPDHGSHHLHFTLSAAGCSGHHRLPPLPLLQHQQRHVSSDLLVQEGHVLPPPLLRVSCRPPLQRTRSSPPRRPLR